MRFDDAKAADETIDVLDAKHFNNNIQTSPFNATHAVAQQAPCRYGDEIILRRPGCLALNLEAGLGGVQKGG